VIGDVFVIDATVHAFNFMPSNYKVDWLPELARFLYDGATRMFSPPDDPKWLMTFEEFTGCFAHYPQLLPETLFGESQLDVAVYHGVPLEGVYRDGSSPIWVAQRVRELYPGRIEIYGPIYPWRDDALDEVDRLVDEIGVIGLKLYPVDLFDGELKPTIMDDERTMAVVERAGQRGLRMIGIHKAVPLGPMPLEPYQNVADCWRVVEAFPDMVFEIVHGGVAFLPETMELLGAHDNVAINLEGTASFSIQLQEQFATIMAAILDAGGAKRTFFSTAAMGSHPRPVIEHFWGFTMPEGAPQLTAEIKRDMLGLNYARYLGWDLAARANAISDDKFATQGGLHEPWSYLHAVERTDA
jgi:predicted TIM-barrel fold metal-dependent hydrolase